MPRFQAHEHPPPSSLSVSESSFSDALHFQAHQPAPLSSSPPESEPSFVTCHISKLTNPFLPLSPLQKANPHFQHAMFPSSPTCFSSSSPPGSESSFCNVPRFQAHQPIPPSSSPPGSESSFATCHISELTNPPLPHFLPSSKCVTAASYSVSA